jgi:hypothetical protein
MPRPDTSSGDRWVVYDHNGIDGNARAYLILKSGKCTFTQARYQATRFSKREAEDFAKRLNWTMEEVPL